MSDTVPGKSPVRRRIGRRPKDIGTDGERWVVEYLRANGWPGAERRALHGRDDRGDITGTVGLAWEVKSGHKAKSAGPKEIATWLDQALIEATNAGAELGILVTARSGYGRARVGMWHVHMPLDYVAGARADLGAVTMTLETACRWLRWLGYGEPL